MFPIVLRQPSSSLLLFLSPPLFLSYLATLNTTSPTPANSRPASSSAAAAASGRNSAAVPAAADQTDSHHHLFKDRPKPKELRRTAQEKPTSRCRKYEPPPPPEPQLPPRPQTRPRSPRQMPRRPTAVRSTPPMLSSSTTATATPGAPPRTWQQQRSHTRQLGGHTAQPPPAAT